MRYSFTYSLSRGDKENWANFFNSFNFISIFQYPKWLEITNPLKKICYFYLLDDDNKIISACVIIENKFVSDIYFGPISHNPYSIVDSIAIIKKHYKKKHFGIIRIIQHNNISFKSELVEYVLSSKLLFKQFINKNNWTSIRIDLTKSIEEIKNAFSKNHKRSIKKSSINNLIVKKIDTLQDVESFAFLYDEMYTNRKIRNPFNNTVLVFKNIYTFFEDNKNGYMLGAFIDSKLVGGIILSYQGDTVFYCYGATDYNYKIPILHKVFLHGIINAKETNYNYFDFGGYNHMVSQRDQVYNINQFKKGFGGDFIFYPKRIYIKLNRVIFLVYHVLKVGYRLVNLFKMKIDELSSFIKDKHNKCK